MKRSLALFLAFSMGCVHAGVEGAGATRDAPPATGDAPASQGTRDLTERAETGTSPPAHAQPGPHGGAELEAPRGEPTDTQRDEPAEATAPAEADARERLVRAARKHLGRSFAGDCSAFVRRVFTEAGVVLPELRAARTMTEALYRSMWPVARPQPGDLAYFRNTRRRDRGEKDRFRLTHIAIVEAVDGARVTMIHRSSRGIRRLAMNLEHPNDPDENGILRRRRATDRKGLPSLSGELFAGYATPLRHLEQPSAIAHLSAAIQR